MPKHLSALAAAVGVGLAVIVTVSGFRTSGARFAASTDNRSNLWEAAEIAMDVDDEQRGQAELFLNASGLHTRSEVQNCVLVHIDASTGMARLRLHGEILSDDGLAALFDVVVEQGTTEGGCDRFTVASEIYRGTLRTLATVNGSFDRGVPVPNLPSEPTPLRFTGSIQDSNDAQGKALEYLVRLEAKP